MKEKNKKRVHQKNEKTLRNEALLKNSHLRDKHLDSPLSKIRWTIL